ncbi:MAG TPA: metal-transporting ATPase, partial [Deltaproteobacteria bacterium]|nr:metal-transporting ATPase [Deltaproteobacteria bacterium]
DKTGTLTQNKMQVAQPLLFSGHNEEELFQTAALASKQENRDPIELPIFQYLAKHFPDAEKKSYRQISFTPFDPIRKRSEAVIEQDGERFTAMKGAAQVLLGMAQLSEEATRKINQSVDELAGKGYRSLAVGRKQGEAPLELLGLIPLYDPPREDSKQVIAEMNDYGVKVKMVTGDNLAIAREIGRLLGLPQHTLRASQLYNHESTIVELIESADIFAEVVPEDKYRIVDSLQKGGHIVAMTGDGVNDAPALKKADCGIAVSNATDAARAAADIILTGPGLGVINEAIQQARITFERMKSYSIFRIAETIRIILFMALAIVVFNFYPITALMIILLALLNDIPILAIAYDRTKVDDKPVRWNMPEMLTISSILGISGVLSSFLLFYILVEWHLPTALIQSMFFAKLTVAGHGTIYNTRIDDWFWKKPYPSRLLFSATFSTRILGTLIAVYGIFITPIGWTYALAMWAYALAWFLFNDVVKMGTYRILRRRGMDI